MATFTQGTLRTTHPYDVDVTLDVIERYTRVDDEDDSEEPDRDNLLCWNVALALKVDVREPSKTKESVHLRVEAYKGKVTVTGTVSNETLRKRMTDEVAVDSLKFEFSDLREIDFSGLKLIQST